MFDTLDQVYRISLDLLLLPNYNLCLLLTNVIVRSARSDQAAKHPRWNGNNLCLKTLPQD